MSKSEKILKAMKQITWLMLSVIYGQMSNHHAKKSAKYFDRYVNMKIDKPFSIKREMRWYCTSIHNKLSDKYFRLYGKAYDKYMMYKTL